MEPYDPELFALTHRGNAGDVRFYVERCRGAGDVLELGCGYGRLALPLVQAGLRCVGVDVHRGLLERARAAAARLSPEEDARLELVEGDMRDVALGRRFARVLIPYNALYCLLDDAAVRAALGNVRRHLAAGGHLLLDGYCVDGTDVERLELGAGAPSFLTSLTRGGQRIDVFERSPAGLPPQRADTVYTYVFMEPSPLGGFRPVRRAVHAIPQRFLTTAQLRTLLAAERLELVELFGGFDERPCAPTAEQWVAVARHA